MLNTSLIVYWCVVFPSWVLFCCLVFKYLIFQMWFPVSLESARSPSLVFAAILSTSSTSLLVVIWGRKAHESNCSQNPRCSVQAVSPRAAVFQPISCSPASGQRSALTLVLIHRHISVKSLTRPSVLTTLGPLTSHRLLTYDGDKPESCTVGPASFSLDKARMLEASSWLHSGSRRLQLKNESSSPSFFKHLFFVCVLFCF